MAFRMIFYWCLSLAIAGMIALVAIVLLVFFEFMPTSVLVFFSVCFLAVACAAGFVANKKIRSKESDAVRRQKQRLCAVSLLIPISTAVGSVSLIAMAATPTWHLPRSESETIKDISRGNYATFMVDEQVYAYDFEGDRVVRWQLTPVNSSKEIVSSGPFMHYYNGIVGMDGKKFKIHVPKRHISADIFIPPDATRIFYEVTYSKEENGVWRKSIDGTDEPERYAEHGRDLFWTRDLNWTFMCTGRGLEKVDREGIPTVIVPAPKGFHVADPVMSPDESKIAFLMKTEEIEGPTTVYVSSLDGKLTKIYSDAKASIREPQWSNDGLEVGFRYTPPRNGTNSVCTIATAKADGSGSKILRRFTPGGMLTHRGVTDFCWSPDDSRIVFLGSFGASLLKDEGGGTCHKFDLYVIDRDGGGFKRLTKLKQTMRTSPNGFPVIWWAAKQ